MPFKNCKLNVNRLPENLFRLNSTQCLHREADKFFNFSNLNDSMISGYYTFYLHTYIHTYTYIHFIF